MVAELPRCLRRFGSVRRARISPVLTLENSTKDEDWAEFLRISRLGIGLHFKNENLEAVSVAPQLTTLRYIADLEVDQYDSAGSGKVQVQECHVLLHVDFEIAVSNLIGLIVFQIVEAT